MRPALLVAALALAVIPRLCHGAMPCEADIKKFCADVPTGEGRVQACLQQHEKELSPACAARHDELTKEMGTLAATCRFDITRLCPDVSPGQGRIARCLNDNASDLSPTCRDQLQKAQKPPAH